MSDCSRLLSMLCIVLLLDFAPGPPIIRRGRRYVYSDYDTPLEMPVEHFGLVDDYGVLPKHASSKHRVTRKEPEGLAQAGKSKRDEVDLWEFYYDDNM